jgi:hypothetical protein
MKTPTIPKQVGVYLLAGRVSLVALRQRRLAPIDAAVLLLFEATHGNETVVALLLLLRALALLNRRLRHEEPPTDK